VKPFNWWRVPAWGPVEPVGRQSTGGAIMTSRPCQGRLGHRLAYRYKDLEPWYDHVERFAGCSGSRRVVAIADGQFLPPMEMNCVEKDVAARIKGITRGQRI